MTGSVHYDAGRLFEYLDAKGIRMAWLARRSGYSENYLTLIKTGRKPATSSFARRTSAALELPMSLLFLPVTLSERSESLGDVA